MCDGVYSIFRCVGYLNLAYFRKRCGRPHIKNILAYAHTLFCYESVWKKHLQNYSNCAWLWYESQFETVETIEEIVVGAEDDGIANYIGNDGDIINGESYSKENDDDPC